MPKSRTTETDKRIMEYVKAGKYEKVKEILCTGNYDPSYCDDNDRTSLHWACEYGYFKLLCLLKEFKWNINYPDDKDQIPLTIACNYKNADIASYLISGGCDVNKGDAAGNTPLHRAIHANLENVVYMLLERGANLNAKNKSDWTPLHEATRIGNQHIVRRLLELGADVNATVSENNATPFSTAIFYYKISKSGHYTYLDAIGKMLIENGCHLSIFDRQWTPLLSSISVCNSYLSSLLLYHGCRIETHKSYSRSLFVDAFTCCDAIDVKLLILCGYRVKNEEIELCARIIPTYSNTPFVGLDLGTNGVHTIQWLRKHILKVPSLSDICRISIRKSLNFGSGDTSILKNIEKLILPPKLKQYIAFDELGNFCDEPF